MSATSRFRRKRVVISVATIVAHVHSFNTALRHGVAAALAMLILASGASATVVRSDAIDPGTRVNGMQVVQGIAQDADVALFGYYCAPNVLSPGRRVRVCSRALPRVRRIFVGHGYWDVSKRRLESWWRANADRTQMWIDGQSVRLDRFGHSDRWLLNYPAADGRDALLREWAIVLFGAEGRHFIRYRGPLGKGFADTTWRFTVGGR
jgi:hypothetical protein